MRREYRTIAHVTKTHGRRGEVVAVPAGGLPSLMYEGLTVCAVPPERKGSRWHVVASCGGTDAGQLVRFEDVRDLDGASALVGKALLACVDDLPDDLAFHDPEALIGLAVEDETYGALGTIREVMRGPANDVWSVQGSFGEVLVPVVDELVLGIDDDDVIHVDLPQGLVDAEGGEKNA